MIDFDTATASSPPASAPPPASLSWRLPQPTPLYAACTYGHVDVVRLLLASEEIDINKEVHGFTPLQFAQAGGYTEIVALLQHAHQEL